MMTRLLRIIVATSVVLVTGCEEQNDPEASKIDPLELKQHLLTNLGALAVSAASFVVCATEPTVPDERSLAWTGHQIELSDIVEQLAKHFGDEGLQFSFQMSTLTTAYEPEFRADTLAQTGQCGHEALQRAADHVVSIHLLAERYLALPRDALKAVPP